MIYFGTFCFIICGIIRLFKGDINEFFIFMALGGLYLIPAIIRETFLKFYSAMYKALTDTSNFLDEVKSKIKEQQKNVEK